VRVPPTSKKGTKRVKLFLCGLILGIAMLDSAFGQVPDTPQIPPTPVTMGQPHKIRYTWGPLVGYDFDVEQFSGRLFLDVTTRGLYPQFGFGSVTAELALGAADRDFDSAIGAYFKVPWVRLGGEYNFLDQKFIPAIVAELAVTRGGLFNKGDEFRIDIRPWDKQLMIGLTFNSPFSKYRLTRPTKDFATLRKSKVPKEQKDAFAGISTEDKDALDNSIASIEHGLVWMDRLLTPHFKTGEDFAESAQSYKQHISQPGHTFLDENARYHQSLARAFAVALGGDAAAGEETAAAAESIVFEEIIVPWNRLFGQNKDPHHPAGLITNAIMAFDAHLARSENVGGNIQRETVARGVFRRTCNKIQNVAIDNRNRWKQAHLIWLRQSRLAWLPLNYGLRPEQYDTQAEVDEVISTLTKEAFTDANCIEYLLNEQFHIHLKQMIQETQAYHVFIIHDFRGRVGKGETDVIGWNVVTDGYIRAFRTAIREMDEGKRDRLPQFNLFLDEFYYQTNKSREVITFLENLYDGTKLELKDKDIQARVSAAHAALRTTISESSTLRGMSEDQLRGLIKLQVNVTHPFDPAFADDSLLRDHRKIAFRDVFEDDPSLGAAIFTGQGVGEHYNGPSWEDRSLVVRGPGNLKLKKTARALFLSQGFEEKDVPLFLRPRPMPADYEQRCESLRASGCTTPLAVFTNDTGFGGKQATVLKAVLYNLAGPGGVMIALDSIWASEYWAGMFIAAALRGARAFPVGPAEDNAPSRAAPTMYLMRENMEMMLQASEYFHDDIEKAGGKLRVGLYTSDIPVYELKRRLDAFLDGMEKYPFLADEFALHPAVVEYLREAAAHYDSLFPPAPPDRSRVPALTSDHEPFIHMKAQFFASGQAFDIFCCEEWRPVIERYLAIRHDQTRGLPTAGITPGLLHGSATDGPASGLESAFNRQLAELPGAECERATFMFTIGSHNQDRRGMILDGEVLVAVSGCDATITLADIMFLLGTAFWPESITELRTEFPQKAPGWLKRVYFGIKDVI
jgi:hypothetical protein